MVEGSASHRETKRKTSREAPNDQPIVTTTAFASKPYLLSPDAEGGQDQKLTARHKRKLRKEFSQLGRDSVRYNVQIGGYGVAQRRDLALEWLREQEDEDDKIKRWTLYAAVIAAAISMITSLAKKPKAR